jgi:hypothetical protein
MPLYVAASGHGDLLRFQNLAEALAGVCDVRMLQPPVGEPFKRITDLAARYADAIQALGLQAGFVAGFSIGGVAALETTRLLEQRGVPVRGLILIDTVYPKAVWGGTFYWRIFSWLVRHLRIGQLSLNGRRLGAMVNDTGLTGQVMAMGGYRVGWHSQPHRADQDDRPVALAPCCSGAGASAWERVIQRAPDRRPAWLDLRRPACGALASAAGRHHEGAAVKPERLRHKLVHAGAGAAGGGGLAVAWSWSPMRAWLDVDGAVAAIRAWGRAFGPVAALGGFALALVLAVPLDVPDAGGRGGIRAGGRFGACRGRRVAGCGAQLHGGRLLGREVVERLAGPRVNLLSQAPGAPGSAGGALRYAWCRWRRLRW